MLLLKSSWRRISGRAIWELQNVIDAVPLFMSNWQKWQIIWDLRILSRNSYYRVSSTQCDKNQLFVQKLKIGPIWIFPPKIQINWKSNSREFIFSSIWIFPPKILWMFSTDLKFHAKIQLCRNWVFGQKLVVCPSVF